MSHDVFKEVKKHRNPHPPKLPNQESIQIFPPGSQDAPNSDNQNVSDKWLTIPLRKNV